MINIDEEANKLIIDNENLNEKKKASIIETMRIIMNHQSDLTQWDKNNESILSTAYNIGDDGYLLDLINIAQPIDFLKHHCGKNFLRKIVNEKNKFILLKTLNLCSNLNIYNEFLLELSLIALKNDDQVSFRMLLRKCTDKNIILSNGETFLSNLIKTNEKESLIKIVIESKLFDLNVINKNKETVLIVAIKKFLINTVEILLQNGCDVGYNNVEAAQITVAVKTKAQSEKNRMIADQILKLLFGSKEVDKNLNDEKEEPPFNENDIEPKINHGLYEKKIVKLMSLLFVHKGQLEICNNENNSVLSLAYDLHDKRFFQILLDNYDKPLDIFANQSGHNLVQEIIKPMDWESLLKVLDRNVQRDEDSIQFLNLAHIALMNKKMDVYNRLINKCFNTNAFLSDGETFVTNLFTKKVDDEMLETVIKSNLFDLKQANQNNQTPLMLACQNLMPNVVEMLVDLGSDISFNDFQALEIVFKASESAKCEENTKKKNEIFSIFLKLKKKQLISIKDDLNNLFIINPKFITKVEGKQVAEKLIIWRCDDRKNILKLKWKGLVDDKYCLGCITKRETEFGTNGKFGNAILFKCEDKHGVLIPIDSVTDCCLKVGHKKIIESIEGLIDENSICCIKSNEKEENNFKISDYLSKKEKNVFATCKWIGQINKVKVVGVQLDLPLNIAKDGMFCGEQIFQCPEKCGGLFKMNGFNKVSRYTYKVIPPKDRIFENIEINSPVKYYFANNGPYKDLYGTVKWSGVNEKGEYLYGIELDDQFTEGTDGMFKEERLFQCQNGLGILAPINLIGTDTRFVEKDLFLPNDLPSAESNVYSLCIGSKLMEGRNKGIQGTKSSFFECLLFSLFAKTDALDYLIKYESDDIAKDLRYILTVKIVYPLRQFGFVSHHKIEEIKKYGLDTTELDSVNSFDILSKLCPDEQLVKMVSVKFIETCAMCLQLPLRLGKKFQFMNTEEMLHFSMILNDFMFNDLPSCLIIKVPRDVNNETTFCEFLIPSNIIEISNLCSKYHKKCSQCNDKAIYQCKRCVEKKFDVENSFTCVNHKCRHKSSIQVRSNDFKSNSKIFLDLRAIICHNGSNFVAYVKQIDFESHDSKWYFYDSMTSTVQPNHYAAPNVTYSTHASRFLNESTDCKKKYINSNPYDNIKDIIKNSHIFVYFNSAKTCY